MQFVFELNPVTLVRPFTFLFLFFSFRLIFRIFPIVLRFLLVIIFWLSFFRTFFFFNVLISREFSCTVFSFALSLSLSLSSPSILRDDDDVIFGDFVGHSKLVFSVCGFLSAANIWPRRQLQEGAHLGHAIALRTHGVLSG